jgi:hypothetical protein
MDTKLTERCLGLCYYTTEKGSKQQQGCVIAPLLFTVLLNHVVRQAQAAMPEGCTM